MYEDASSAWSAYPLIHPDAPGALLVRMNYALLDDSVIPLRLEYLQYPER